MMIRNLSRFLFSLELKDKLATFDIRCDRASEEYLEIQSKLPIDEVDKILNDIVPSFGWHLERSGRKTKGTVRILIAETETSARADGNR